MLMTRIEDFALRMGIAPETLLAPQIPVKPVPVAALTVEKPEWGGHRESSPSARPSAGEAQDFGQITGISNKKPP